MNKALTGFVAAGLLFAVASCGSDDASTSSDTKVEVSDDTVASGDTTAAQPATGDIGSLQAAVLAQTIAAAADAGFTVDENCLATGIAKLSDEDAQAILDAGPTGDPDVSDAADDVATEIGTCVTPPEDATSTT